MPSVSKKQHDAMEAAAHGHSTLGIPKKVGEEFVAKDAKPSIAAGVLFVAPDGDMLLLLRSRTEENFAAHWALPGGKADGDETAEECARRECEEELGDVPDGELELLDQINTPNGMVYSTFMQRVEDKFYPKLNNEHAGYIWAPPSDLPSPLHPSVQRLLEDLSQQAKERYDWSDGQLEIIQPENPQPAPAPIDEIDESEVDPTLELEITE